LSERYGYHPEFVHLREAIASRDRVAVEAVLDERPYVATAADVFGANALHWSALTRQMGLIDLFLELGVDGNACRADGSTPLHLSIEGDYWFRKERRMGMAIRADRVVAGYLLARGVDYLFTVACLMGDRERVEAVLRADPGAANRLDTSRRSPLHYAAREGYTELVEVLLDAGADPNQMETWTTGGMALFSASAANHLDTARLLLERGADPNVEVDSSGTPLSIVAHIHPDCCGAMQALLRDYGARDAIWAITPDEWMAKLEGDGGVAYDARVIKHIMRHGDERLITALLDRNPGAFRQLGGEGVTALPPDAAVVRCILDAGVDVNRRDWGGRTMVWQHAHDGHVEIVEMLIDAGADINVLDALDGCTPLATAAAAGHEEVVRLLLARGADATLGDGPWAVPAIGAREG
jgi:ankyrin repeat protein